MVELPKCAQPTMLANKCHCSEEGRFNLRRDARPLATAKKPARQQHRKRFQSQARCQASGDCTLDHVHARYKLFQSQARCQASGDEKAASSRITSVEVSISGEMPGLWRRLVHWDSAQK